MPRMFTPALAEEFNSLSVHPTEKKLLVYDNEGDVWIAEFRGQNGKVMWAKRLGQSPGSERRKPMPVNKDHTLENTTAEQQLRLRNSRVVSQLLRGEITTQEAASEMLESVDRYAARTATPDRKVRLVIYIDSNMTDEELGRLLEGTLHAVNEFGREHLDMPRYQEVHFTIPPGSFVWYKEMLYESETEFEGQGNP